MTSPRKRLSNRRQIDIFDSYIANTKYTTAVSHFEDGSLAEIFIEAGRVGSDLHESMRSAGIVTSLAWQHGCSPKTLKAALPKLPSGKPADALGILVDLALKE